MNNEVQIQTNAFSVLSNNFIKTKMLNKFKLILKIINIVKMYDQFVWFWKNCSIILHAHMLFLSGLIYFVNFKCPEKFYQIDKRNKKINKY